MIVVGMMIVIAVVGYYALRFVRANSQRIQEYNAERQKFLDEFSGTLQADEIATYKNLPTHEARIVWLKENHPEFIDKMPYSIIEFKTAECLDVKLLQNNAAWDEAELLQRYLDYCENISISSYQEDLDSFDSWVESKTQLGLDREKASAELWESLDNKNRLRFKQTRLASERKQILMEASRNSNSTYETDYLYPVVLTTFLGVDSSDSSYFDGGSFDTGSDSSGGDSDGGDGGGGGGD